MEYTGSFSIKRQTGWNRPNPKVILQKIDLLLKITRYDYDLTDPDFVLYAHNRGCMEGAGIPELSDPDYEYNRKREYVLPFNGDRGQLRRWVRDHNRTSEEFLASDDHRLTVKGKPISDEDRRLRWKSILIARGTLQDCWEIYCLTEAKHQVQATA